MDFVRTIISQFIRRAFGTGLLILGTGALARHDPTPHHPLTPYIRVCEGGGYDCGTVGGGQGHVVGLMAAAAARQRTQCPFSESRWV